MNTPDMAAWRAMTDLKARHLHLNIPLASYSETDTETTPCITVTPPPSEAWPGVTYGNGHGSSASGDTRKLSPNDIHDVHL